MILVSACLCGINTRYDGKSNLKEDVFEMVRDGIAIPVCPEQLGGLETPRFPSELKDGSGRDVLQGNASVVDVYGRDVTQKFFRGAVETLEICKKLNIKKAVLKSKSPSCGLGKIYDGSFKRKLIDGNGVTCELLLQNNIEVFCENNFPFDLK